MVDICETRSVREEDICNQLGYMQLGQVDRKDIDIVELGGLAGTRSVVSYKPLEIFSK